jgi:ferredoxin-nitrate reductase
LLESPGEARPDWKIGAAFAQALGYGGNFDYSNAESIFNEYRKLTAGTPVDISGITYARLREGPLQ